MPTKRLFGDVAAGHRQHNPDMARFHIAAALGAATFALLVLFQLIWSFGLPQLTFLNLYREEDEPRLPRFQIPINPVGSEPKHGDEDGSAYLLGVGKGDITGYAGCNAWPYRQ